MMPSTPLTPRHKQVPPPCTHRPSFVTRSAAGLHPVPVRSGEVVLWGGGFHLELAKHARTDGDPLVQWAIGGALHGPQAPGGSSTRTPRKASAGDGLFDVHANVRYTSNVLASEPEIHALFVQLCCLCTLRCLFASRFLFANFAQFSQDFRYYNFFGSRAISCNC